MDPNQIIAERVSNLSHTVQALQQELEALKGFIEVSSGIKVAPRSKDSTISKASRAAPVSFDDSASRASTGRSGAAAPAPIPPVPLGDQQSTLSRVTVSRHGIHAGTPAAADGERTWADDLSFSSTISKVANSNTRW